ncbi:hypothetical protein ACLUWS_06695 [Bifidobacterium boum]|uniref:hypothetical protein n=1 Tax=Bifidobacterium boum TaxID=78343 RepID=UPI00399659AD
MGLRAEDAALPLLDRDSGREIGRLVIYGGARRLVPGRDVIRFHEITPAESDWTTGTHTVGCVNAAGRVPPCRNDGGERVSYFLPL